MEYYLDIVVAWISDFGRGAGLDLTTAIAIWSLALLLPFRALNSRPEIGWDMLGYNASGVAGIAVFVWVEEPAIDTLMPRLEIWHGRFEALPWWGACLIRRDIRLWQLLGA